MAKFRYTARDRMNARREGFIEAESLAGAVGVLRQQNLMPVSVQPAGEQATEEATITRGRVGLGELALFTRECATMLDAGVPIVDILEDLSGETLNRYFRHVLREVRASIQGGSSLSQALSKFPSVFNPLYIALVKSGEESGRLVGVMEEIAVDLEDRIVLLRKVRQAVSYPAVIVVFFIGVVSFVFLYLIPKFQQIFKSFGADLPVFTKVILAISSTLVRFLPLSGLLLFGLVVFTYAYSRTPAGRHHLDGFRFSIPVLGKLMAKVSLARFARSFATLIAGGVSLPVALEIVAKTAGSSIIEEATMAIRNGIVSGGLVGQEMKKHKIFPSLLVRMVTVGEEKGRVDDMLVRASRFFRDEVDATLSILTSILEPILIIGLGFVVGVVVLAIYLPIFKLAATMR